MNEGNDKFGQNVRMQQPDGTERILLATTPSFARCNWPIAGCLRAAEDTFLGTTRWSARNPTQQILLEQVLPRIGDVLTLSDGEHRQIEAMASRSASEVMTWLIQRGFTIDLPDSGPGDIYAASVLDILLEWLEGKSNRDVILCKHNDRRYTSVKLSRPLDFYESDQSTQPIVCIPTHNSRTKVWLAMVDSVDAQEFGIIDLALTLSTSTRRCRVEYTHALFPMLHLEIMRELDWLTGLAGHSERLGDTCVARAIQMNRLRLNERGVRAQSAAVMTLRSMTIEQNLLFDRPFLLWIMRDGIQEPLFAAWCNTDCWRDPGSLD